MNDDNRPDDTAPEQDLRRLFAETAADIRPLGTLDDIRNRTEKVDPMTRSWFLPSIAAAAVMAFVIGGAFWITQRSDDSTPGPSGTPTATVTTAPTVERSVPVYYAGEAAPGTRLFREFQRMTLCEAPQCLPGAALKAAVTGTPEDADYRSLWPAGTQVGEFTQSADLLTVDLGGDVHDRPAGMTASDAELAVQQVIFTAQAAVGKGRLPVKFLLGGQPTDMILGVPTAEPLAAADDLDVLAPVQISSPTNGQKVKAGKITVTGVAAAFEANVTWELFVGGDAVVDTGFATAQECCTLSPYSFELTLAPGTYTLVVHDEDMSGEGRPVNQDTKEIVVE